MTETKTKRGDKEIRNEKRSKILFSNVSSWTTEVQMSFCIFSNDAHAHAPQLSIACLHFEVKICCFTVTLPQGHKIDKTSNFHEIAPNSTYSQKL